MQTFLRIKVPPGLRVNFVCSENLGDSPTAYITRPKNVDQPTNVIREGDKQYAVVFHASTANESVDLVLKPARYHFFKSFMAVFTIAFWLGLLPGRDFFRTLTFKRVIVGTMISSGLLFFTLVGLELSGVNIHKPIAKWFNQLEMAERSGDAIKRLLGTEDPFFKSAEAQNFFNRTGKKLDKIYLLTKVIDGDKSYRMLVRKDYLGADDLDSAEDICKKELNGKVPSKSDYKLIVKDEGLRSEINWAFAEWTTTSRGVISDDVHLFLLEEYVGTWQINIAEIKAASGEKLTSLATAYDIQRDGMGDNALRDALIVKVNEELRLPASSEIEYEEGLANFYLDSDDEANFRCVRKLASAD